MALTMLRAKQFAMSLALVVFASGATVFAQVNPATVKSAAQNGAQTATKSAAQSSATASNSTKPAPAGTATKQQTPPPASQKTVSKPPAQTPATSAAAKPQSQAKAPATQTKAPAASSKPAATQPKPSAAQTKTAAPAKAEQPAATSAAKTATPDKKPVTDKKPPMDKKPATAATQSKPAPAQKTPPAANSKPGAAVTTTKKPAAPQGRRDPFIGLVGKQPVGGGPGVVLPPGKGGLQVSTIMLQGIVSGPNGMIAVVANPQKSVYFLRVGDELFDGRVEKIEIGAVFFHEVGKDAFGKPLERQVIKKLNPSSGDLP